MVRLADALDPYKQYESAVTSRTYVWEKVAFLLSHNIVRISHISDCVHELTQEKGAARVIKSIWSKWDIENDCPLPEDVERVWREGGANSGVVWKKCGSLYYTSMSKLSA